MPAAIPLATGSLSKWFATISPAGLLSYRSNCSPRHAFGNRPRWPSRTTSHSSSNEKRALKIVGICFLGLAAYIAYESVSDLWLRRAPEHSIPGIALACVSLVVMPLLSRAKRKVGRALGSAAMHADAKHTEFCR